MRHAYERIRLMCQPIVENYDVGKYVYDYWQSIQSVTPTDDAVKTVNCILLVIVYKGIILLL